MNHNDVLVLKKVAQVNVYSRFLDAKFDWLKINFFL